MVVAGRLEMPVQVRRGLEARVAQPAGDPEERRSGEQQAGGVRVPQVVEGVVPRDAASLLGESPEAHPEPSLVTQHGPVPDGRENEVGRGLSPGQGAAILRGHVVPQSIGQGVRHRNGAPRVLGLEPAELASGGAATNLDLPSAEVEIPAHQPQRLAAAETGAQAQ